MIDITDNINVRKKMPHDSCKNKMYTINTSIRLSTGRHHRYKYAVDISEMVSDILGNTYPNWFLTKIFEKTIKSNDII